MKAREDEGGRTVDLMRIILTYGLDPIIGTVENKPCLNKTMKESVRRLLKELVERSIEDDGSNFPNSIGRVDANPQDEGKIKVPMKQGDWICPKYLDYHPAIASCHKLLSPAIVHISFVTFTGQMQFYQLCPKHQVLAL